MAATMLLCRVAHPGDTQSSALCPRKTGKTLFMEIILRYSKRIAWSDLKFLSFSFCYETFLTFPFLKTAL